MAKSKKKTPVQVEPESEAESEEAEIFHVEVIAKARVVPLSEGDDTDYEEDGLGRKRLKGGKWEYYVKWADYASDENTWEPEENVAGCERLLRSFWVNVGYDNKDWQVGTIIQAEETWIAKQKKYSKKQIKADKEELKRRKEADRQEKLKEKRKKARETPVASPSKSKDKASPGPASLPPKIKRKRVETESSDEEPLATRSSKREKPRKQKRKVSVETTLATPARAHSPEPTSPTSLFSEDSDKGQEKGKGKAPAKPPPPSKAPAMRPLPLPKRKSSGPANPYIGVSSAPPVSAHPNPSSSPPSTPIVSTPAPGPGPASTQLAGISTKQRLGKIAMEPVPAKATKKYNIPKTTISTLQTLKMKKTPSIPQTSATQNEASGSNLKKTQALPLSPPAPQLGDFFADMEYTDEPLPLGPPDIPPPRAAEKILSRKNSTTQPVPMEVDRFLQSLNFDALAAPLEPAPERPYEVQPPKSLIAPAPKALLPSRIPKKYKWTGKFNYESGGVIKLLCNVSLSNCTDPSTPGMRFKIALEGKTGLELTSFHNATDLDSILHACRPMDQLARLDSHEESDAVPFTTFVQYMAKMQKIGLIPLELDNIIVAHMVLFPPSAALLLKRFDVPADLTTNTGLIAALIPWTLSAAQLEKEWRRPLLSLIATKPKYPELWEMPPKSLRPLKLFTDYQRAVRVLQPDDTFHEYMTMSNVRPWASWEGVDRIEKPAEAPEYEVLKSFVERYAKSEESWRVFFIHLGELSTVHLCPCFVERRSRRLDCAIFTYGTHHSFPPQEWGLKEIYTCGGIVTFAPQVLMRDAMGVEDLINEVDEHPLWLSYVLPSAIGIAARLLYGEEQADRMLARPEFALRPLLKAIEEGKISLISRPPDLVSSRESERTGWMSKYFWQHPDDALNILEVSLKATASKYSNAPQQRWVYDFETEVTEDLLAMQRQPALMRNYRRYVVVSDDHKPSSHDRVEWNYLNTFTFGDNFSLKFAPQESHTG